MAAILSLVKRQERISYSSYSLRSWLEKNRRLVFSYEVSSVPLQVLETFKAFANFRDKRAKYPRFNAKRNGGSATKSDFKYQINQLWLAKSKEPLPIAGLDLCLKVLVRLQLQLNLNLRNDPTVEVPKKQVGIDVAVSNLLSLVKGLR